ncbi:MAG: hypothetical protein H0U76_06380 [Ktedonobacteraceae bacterium]|nr:hypothetical protein [Ktedonobacteraceae bacterium]
MSTNNSELGKKTLYCVALVVDEGQIVPMRQTTTIRVADEGTQDSETNTQELLPVTNRHTTHALRIGTLRAAIDTLLDDLGEISTLDEMEDQQS